MLICSWFFFSVLCALLAYHPAIRIVNLRKIYRNGFFKRKEDKTAVKDLCLTFEEGKLFALLGQNGAGKSTTMNVSVSPQTQLFTNTHVSP